MDFSLFPIMLLWLAILALGIIALRQKRLLASLRSELSREAERRHQAQDALERTQDSIEELVGARTRALEASNRTLLERSDLLERYQRVTRDRELDILELKTRLNELSEQLGRPLPYRLPQSPIARRVLSRGRQ